MGSDVDAVTKSGRLFHTRAAATGKARIVVVIIIIIIINDFAPHKSTHSLTHSQ